MVPPYVVAVTPLLIRFTVGAVPPELNICPAVPVTEATLALAAAKAAAALAIVAA